MNIIGVGFQHMIPWDYDSGFHLLPKIKGLLALYKEKNQYFDSFCISPKNTSNWGECRILLLW